MNDFFNGGIHMNDKQELETEIAEHLAIIKRLRADLEAEERELQNCYDELNLIEESNLTSN